MVPPPPFILLAAFTGALPKTPGFPAHVSARTSPPLLCSFSNFKKVLDFQLQLLTYHINTLFFFFFLPFENIY